jgi:hypothetical protein
MAQQLDWAILAKTDTVKDVTPQKVHTYDLYNITEKECVVYGQREWGINLVWGDPEKGDSVFFQKESGKTDPLKFEEHLAINIRGGGFVVYQGDRHGINLGWSKDPKFEWKIMGGPAGHVVPAGMVVGLYHLKENDYLMYESREYGINLKWFKDTGKFKGGFWSGVYSFAKRTAGKGITVASGGWIPGDKVVDAVT